MDKKRIEIIATVVMVFILAVAWVNTLSVMRRRSKPRPVAAAVVAPLVMPAEKAASQPQKNNAQEQLAALNWGRDPFSGRVYVAPSNAEGIGDLKVEGIVWDPRHPLAMINGRVLRKGDNFRGNVVVNIKEDSVILSDGNRDLEIKVGK